MSEKYGEKYGCHIPVVLAAAFQDRASAQSLPLALGVDDCTTRLATRFCDNHKNVHGGMSVYKEAYSSGQIKKDIQGCESPVGMPGQGHYDILLWERVDWPAGKDITEEVPAHA